MKLNYEHTTEIDPEFRLQQFIVRITLHLFIDLVEFEGFVEFVRPFVEVCA